jgi:hypothetical protein
VALEAALLVAFVISGLIVSAYAHQIVRPLPFSLARTHNLRDTRREKPSVLTKLITLKVRPADRIWRLAVSIAMRAYCDIQLPLRAGGRRATGNHSGFAVTSLRVPRM